MDIVYDIKKVKVTPETISFELSGEIISVPLKATCSKILMQSNQEQLQSFEVIPAGVGIYWPLLDEDVSIEGLLRFAGRSDLIKEHTLPAWCKQPDIAEAS